MRSSLVWQECVCVWKLNCKNWKSCGHGFGFDLGFTAKNGKIQSCPKHNIEYVFWARILCRIHFWSQKCKICYSFLNININVESCASDGSQNMRPTSSVLRTLQFMSVLWGHLTFPQQLSWVLVDVYIIL